METGLAVLMLVIAIYASVAHWLSSRSITMPIILVLVGLLLGPRVLNIMPFSPGAELEKALTEIALALLLFADASTLNLGAIRRDAQLPARLLFLAMPMVIALGAVVALLLFPHELVGYALLLATILAPTDAALGMAIFENPQVPVRIRRALNVESGLNDGIATPFITLFIALALAEEGGSGNWLVAALVQIVVAVVVGGLIGALGAKLLSMTSRRGWTEGPALKLAIVSLSVGCYLCSVVLHGNGFIAAFVGGLVFGTMAEKQVMHDVEYTEITGTYLSAAVWILFGVALAPIAIFDLFSWRAVLYAVLSLTVVRMIPVWLAMMGTGFRLDTVALMGWFGPHGLASVVFTLIAVVALEEGGAQNEVLVACAFWTILLSVVAHGLSAQPLANWYGKRLQASANPNIPELQDIPELKTRRRIFAAQPAPSPLPVGAAQPTNEGVHAV